MFENFALLTSIFRFPCLAISRTSVPIYSPSRSQSVQINRALAPRASLIMLSLTSVRSYCHHGSKSRSVEITMGTINLIPYLADFIDGGVEELKRIAVGPASVVFWKIPFNGVTQHRRHGNLTVWTPWWRKVVDKVKVLDIRIPSFSLDDSQIQDTIYRRPQTVRILPPAR